MKHRKNEVIEVEKADLIRRKAEMQTQLAEKRQQIMALERKIDRLQKAKGQLTIVINDSQRHKKEMTSIQIDPSFWQGNTKNDYQNHSIHEVGSSAGKYVTDLHQVEERINEEIQRLSSQLDQCESDSYLLQSTITNLDDTMKSMKEG